MYQKVLVIGAETFSRILDFQDRGTCVLFGDGAGAVVLEASNQAGILSTALHADGSQRDILCVPGRAADGVVHGSPFMTMDGQAVFKLAVKVLEQYSTVTIVGTAATDDCMFMVEGLPAYVADHSQGGDGTSGTAIATKLKADLEASIGSGTATFTVYNGLGSTGFAA